MLSLDIYRYKIFVFRIEKVESLARDKIGFFFSQRIFKYSNNIFLAQNFQISTRFPRASTSLSRHLSEREKERCAMTINRNLLSASWRWVGDRARRIFARCVRVYVWLGTVELRRYGYYLAYFY